MVVVDVLGWDEFGVVVRSGLDFPGGVVDHSVVSSAEEDSVCQVGGSAFGPLVDVVGVAPSWGCLAVGEGASAVSVCEGYSLTFAESPEHFVQGGTPTWVGRRGPVVVICCRGFGG